MALPHRLLVVLAAGTTLACAAIAQDAPVPSTEITAAPAGISQDATFAFSKERWHSDRKIGWDGFLSGLRGFEHFYEPVGQPLYFESPFNTSGLRFLYLYHSFSDDSQLAGGDLNVAALQVRVALTERLGFIATKDGYSWLSAGALPEEDGWNQLAAGIKYVIYADHENDLVITPGVRLMLVTGEDKVLQSDTEEVSPFISIAKGWGRFHTIGNITLRVPFDSDDGNTVLHWDLHADYEIAPETLPGFAPLVEFHGVHYLTDGDRLPLSVGGLDYTNLGSSDVAGSAVVWMGVGARWKLNPHMSIGAVYEFCLTDPDDDIMDRRVTADFQITW